MTIIHTVTISMILILYLNCFALPARAEGVHLCDVDKLLRDSSSDFDGYERVQKIILGKSAEGANVEYYYAAESLKTIKAVYYGETGKLEIRYYFSSPTAYVANLTRYYYSSPIYSDRSEVVATTKGEFVVCHGELVRGIGDDVVVRYFERASEALEEVLAAAPTRNVLEGGSR